MDFPYGKAPFALLLVALLSGAIVAVARISETRRDKPDLVFQTFSETHYESYRLVLPEFERQNNVKVDLQRVSSRALQSRLSAALQVGADTPDVVEVFNLGYFTRGKLEDIDLVDLTDRIYADGLDKQMVASRFALWSTRGRIFGLPHDVHPMGLLYRRDILEQEGIDPNSIETWDDFIRVGKQLTKDLDGDGTIDRYAIDLPATGENAISVLLFQRGENLFNEAGDVVFDTENTADIIHWYVLNMEAPDHVFFSLTQSRDGGRSQGLAQAVQEGFIVFLLAADWRTKMIEKDIPQVSGKMAFMPLPAWEKGGRRTSAWAGTCLAITKNCENVDLAWKLAKFLYLRDEDLATRFAETNILPPVKSAWSQPVFDQPSKFYSNQPLGRMLADLAPQEPTIYSSPYYTQANVKLSNCLMAAELYYREHGEKGLREFISAELHRQADSLRKMIARNHFLKPEKEG